MFSGSEKVAIRKKQIKTYHKNRDEQTEGCAARKSLWSELGEHILPADKAQCWLAGDFNFTECEADRCNVSGFKPSEAGKEELMTC